MRIYFFKYIYIYIYIYDLERHHHLNIPNATYTSINQVSDKQDFVLSTTDHWKCVINDSEMTRVTPKAEKAAC